MLSGSCGSHGASVVGDRAPSLATPFRIGCVEIPNRVVLAPMAGLTTSAYRRHLKNHGAGLVTTEMVSAHGLLHHNVRSAAYLNFVEEERPIAVQLFGDTPEAMARAAEFVLARAAVPELLDVNMGCPVRKVMRTGAGAALLGDPDRAVAVAAAVVHVASQADVPVTVKLRSGLKEGDRTAIELARRLEAAGVQAIGVHPRAASQNYRGLADHTITAGVVQAVKVPVVASGDVGDVASTLDMWSMTGAAAVMVARGVMGDPWLVKGLLSGETVERPLLPVVVEDLRVLLGLAVTERGQEGAARWIRQLLGKYLRPSRVPAAVINHLRRLPDARVLEDALAALTSLASTQPAS